MTIVIADTSCLIVLERTNQLYFLKEVFDTVIITKEVQNEFGSTLPEWIHVENVKDKKQQRILELELDKGEASAIALSLERENSLLLIDEKKGRRVAKELGVRITGTLGVVIRAKEKGMIHSMNEALDKLENVDFRLSESLKQQVLAKYGN